jgi:hypothetical protein
VANQPVELTLQVKRSQDGTWTIHDISNAVPEVLFAAQHNLTPLTALNTFGFAAHYTDTRRDKFFFDNIDIRAPQPDTTAPSLSSLVVIDQQTLELTFSEPVTAASANDINHYTVNDGIGQPDQVSLNAGRNIITLHFANLFASLHPYMIAVGQLQDDAGNTMTTTNREFTYIQLAAAMPYDILITEIMADPTPVIALPDAEYIELYNASSQSFQLADYTFRVGSSERALPDFLLVPDSYVIITDVDAVPQFASHGTSLGIDMPSLTNSGTTLSLLNAADEIIHGVSYSDDWYGDAAKADGGWSLEMKNPLGICEGGSNWTAASNLTGGTPGQENSAWNPVPDTTGPSLVSVFTTSPTTVELKLSERLNDILMLDTENYSISPGIFIDQVSLANESTILLTLGSPLLPGMMYSISLLAFDCIGNLQIIDPIPFGLIVDAQPGDVLINEILFNPATGGSRFIEVINVSDNYINLSTLAIGRLTMQDQDIYTTGIQAAAVPGEIIVFTPDRADILSRFTVPYPENVYEATLPSWDDETDNASLLVNGVVVDSFTYQADWHHPLIADQNGVSLERVSVTAPASLTSNWHSASSLQRYGTPTGINSQVLADTIAQEAPYTLLNRIFSPNEDGFRDYLVLQFDGTTNDAVTSVTIHDMEGRAIYSLASNALAGTSSLLQWDGRNNEGRLADMGMYIVYVQLWRPDGEVNHYQSSCALVKQ